MTNDKFLPFALPSIGEEEIQAVVETLRSGWLTSGIKTQQFESAFAQAVGAPYALAVNSCTAALHLALEAIGVRAGDKVVTSPYTFTATAEVVRYLGADPIFVDIDPLTFNLDPTQLAATLTREKGIKAIIPVHIAGQACDMDAILELAQQHSVKVVEDAAHALPTRYKGRMVGTLGDLTAYSFYVTKTLVTGEGGMVTTGDPEYAQRIRLMRLHGINRDAFKRQETGVETRPSWYYEVVAPGFKYNMSDIMAALGLAQLTKLESLRQRREAIAQRYTAALADLPLWTPQLQFASNTHSWHLYILQLNLERLTIDRDTFIHRLAEAGIGTSVHFIPLHLHPYWQQRYHFKPMDFPVALRAYQRAVSLPIYPDLSDADVERVITQVRTLLLAAQK